MLDEKRAEAHTVKRSRVMKWLLQQARWAAEKLSGAGYQQSTEYERGVRAGRAAVLIELADAFANGRE